MNGLEHPGVLDAIAHDTRTDTLILAMYELRPWSGEEFQLFQLQEKLNAYLSFVLDGELEETYPNLVAKPVEIQLRCAHEPDPNTVAFIDRIREQLAFQRIRFTVIRLDQPEGNCGSADCRCG